MLFIDDDATLGETFLQQMAERLLDDHVHHVAAGGPANRLILTGTEVCHGERVRPHKGAFLGFQQHNYRCGERMYSIVINSTVFPRELFEHVAFDEQLVYGYDEIDLASRAVFKHDFRIEWLASAANHHFPSPANRDYYRPFLHASRIYTTSQALWLERTPPGQGRGVPDGGQCPTTWPTTCASRGCAAWLRRGAPRGWPAATSTGTRGAGTTGGVTPITADSATGSATSSATITRADLSNWSGRKSDGGRVLRHAVSACHVGHDAVHGREHGLGEKRATAAARARTPIRSRSAASASRVRAAASAGASSQGIRMPVSPSSTISVTPPAAVATTGRAASMPSTTTRPNGSARVEACTTTSMQCMSSATSARKPVKWTRPARSGCAARSRSDAS